MTNSNDGKPYAQIVIALIGAVASIVVALIAAGWAADDAVDKRFRELSIVSGGAVGASGDVKALMGQPVTVTHLPPGTYRVNFAQPFASAPIIVALGDSTQQGAYLQLLAVDMTGFSLRGRDNSQRGVSDMGFHFVVIWPKKPPAN